MLDIEVWNYAYFQRGGKGVMMALPDQRDKGIVYQNGFYLAPGTENLVSLKSNRMVVSEGAYKRFSPEKRQCYSDSEYNFM